MRLGLDILSNTILPQIAKHMNPFYFKAYFLP